MSEAEGVIKYQLDFRQTSKVAESLAELNVWRAILYQLGLIGQNPARYQGYGYGNLSMRRSQKSAQFYISASQTGHLQQLGSEHYTLVEHCDIEQNRVVASGVLSPSSEALTHAMIYQLSDRFNCVMHVHDPGLWHYGLDHEWPKTGKEIEYGTPQMASAVRRLYLSGEFAQQNCLVMAGHEDGVICFGRDEAGAGLALIELWVTAGLSD